MNELAYLVQRVAVLGDDELPALDEQGRPVMDESCRDVLCEVLSIGQKEFYAAHGTDFHPELKIKIADYLDYGGQKLVDYEGVRYRVIRTYRVGTALEITLERAPEEDGEAYVDQSG